MNRRNFLHTTATSLAFSVLPILPALSHNFAQYKTALVGSGWWGMNILRCAIQAGESKVVALCDVDENQLKKCRAEVGKLTSDQPKMYRDYREMLAKEFFVSH